MKHANKGSPYRSVGVLPAAGVLLFTSRFRRVCYLLCALYFTWRWVVLSVVYATVGLYALVGPMWVQAQTATPTPTRTPTPFFTPVPTSTPAPGTPLPTPTGGAGDSSVWWCSIWPIFTDPTCNWGSTRALNLRAFGQTINASPPGDVTGDLGEEDTGKVYIVLIPPADTREVRFECDGNIDLEAFDGGSLTGSSRGEYGFIVPGGSVFDVWRNGVAGVTPDFLKFQSGCANGSCSQVWDTHESLRYRLKSGFASWPAGGTAGSTIDEYTDFVSFIGFWVRAVGSGSGHYTNFGFSNSRVSCYVTQIERFNGDIYFPGPPDATPTPGTPQPTATSVFTDWVGVPWVPITSTANAPMFNITEPITETCTVVVPGIEIDSTEADGVGSWWAWLMGVIPLPDVDTTPVEFCTAEWGLDLFVFGYDMGGALVTVMALAAAGVMFSILKSP